MNIYRCDLPTSGVNCGDDEITLFTHYRGRRAPIVGAVSMDMMTVDVTAVDDAVQPGDEVVLIGRQGAETWQQIDVREMAAAIGTIPYEIVCRIGARIERQYTQ